MKKLIGLLTVFGLFLFGPSVLADQYSPSPSYNIIINKTVGRVGNGGVTYYENLSVSDYRFSPKNDIYFQLKVKNTSNDRLYNIIVKDYLPTYIDPIEGAGDYDSSTRIITIKAGDFNSQEEKVYTIKARVYAQESLPADKGIICESNHADAKNDKASSEDYAQFCIEKQVNGATSTTPSAGPELGLLTYSLTILAGYAGWKFKNTK